MHHTRRFTLAQVEKDDSRSLKVHKREKRSKENRSCRKIARVPIPMSHFTDTIIGTSTVLLQDWYNYSNVFLDRRGSTKRPSKVSQKRKHKKTILSLMTRVLL